MMTNYLVATLVNFGNARVSNLLSLSTRVGPIIAVYGGRPANDDASKAIGVEQLAICAWALSK